MGAISCDSDSLRVSRRRSYLSAHSHRKVLSWTRKSARGAIKVLLVPVYGGPWQGVALKPRGLHNHARQGLKLSALPRARRTPTRDAFPPPALSRMHCNRTAIVVQVRLISLIPQRARNIGSCKRDCCKLLAWTCGTLVPENIVV
jgi:hypothetical protein